MICIISAGLLSSCILHSNGSNETISRKTLIMGTYLEIKIIFNKDEILRSKIENEISEAIKLGQSLEQKLSMFDAGSELNELNLSKKMNVTDDLYEVVKLAVEVSRDTNGYFDVTVAPLLKKQGFYTDVPKEVFVLIPDTYLQLGWEKIKFLENNIIELDGNIWLDLSGIAKGYIVDRIAKYLKQQNFGTFLVNAGGDMYCSSSDGHLWKIGIISPGENKVLEVLELKNEAVATSGDYENWVISDEDKNTKISHIADPLEGDLLKKSFSSATVIADTCAKADALSTAMMAMGPVKASEIAKQDKSIRIINVNKTKTGYDISE
ncbi:MAG: FAD:protein FMN transferase [Candidatus Omnitrophica bacterium]|nr:FAD:protein FMN transferase [Candidatus Omnitrophota bacterium]